MNKLSVLSKRLTAVAGMVTNGNRACDVGCDHGFLSIYLVENKISPGVVAMDINEGPLSRAREHIRRFNLEGYIETRLSDGLSSYRTGEADSLICAGMGGRLMIKILDQDEDKTRDFKELILQPQSEVPVFRKYLREHGYSILTEEMIWEDGKFYPIIKAYAEIEGKTGPNSGKSELEDRFGPKLLLNKNPALLLFIRQEWLIYKKIKEELIRASRGEIKYKRLKQIEEEMSYLQKAAEQLGCVDLDREDIIIDDYHYN